MRVVRPSSVEEYASWFLRRAARGGDPDPIPDKPEEQVQAMWDRHRHKMRDWFSAGTRWHIVMLDAIRDLADLVFLESPWTKSEGLVVPGGSNYRFLDRVAANAIKERYLVRPSAHKHKAYYDSLAAGTCRLEGEDRIAICSAEPTEMSQNPVARYYLLDGVGRCLPYMILVTEQKLTYQPVEAFLAEREAA